MEVMIVVVIVAILAAVAIPSYNSFVKSSRRADAKSGLVALQFAEEKYRGNNTSYTTNPVSLGLTASAGATSWLSPEGYYTLSIQSADGSSYAAKADVNTASVQNSDISDCPTLKITQTGFVIDDTAECWGLQ